MKLGVIVTLLFLALLFLSIGLSAQDNSSYIYGTITTASDEGYTGFIRWGKEEMYWHDVFNSVKSKAHKPAKKRQNNNIRDNINWSLKSIWEDNYCNSCHSEHVFACLFGDIAEMRISSNSRVDLIFKNGSSLEVKGGSNDVGATLHMTDYELGKIRFEWDDIESIVFAQAPDGVVPPYGSILYGTVRTERHKEFTGYVKWDLDERCGQDIMNGESKNGSLKIPFENIKTIKKTRNGEAVHLTMDSDRTLDLHSSNDCDKGNRGIAVYAHGIGNIEISWADFEGLTFVQAPNVGVSYEDFKPNFGIEATVHTFTDSVTNGYIAFDKDEIWNFEFIDGDDDDIKYQIPIRNISKMAPKNRSFSLVQLKNGETLLLGERQDVNSQNDGILILNQEDNKTSITLDWENILEVIFK